MVDDLVWPWLFGSNTYDNGVMAGYGVTYLFVRHRRYWISSGSELVLSWAAEIVSERRRRCDSMRIRILLLLHC